MVVGLGFARGILSVPGLGVLLVFPSPPLPTLLPPPSPQTPGALRGEESSYPGGRKASRLPQLPTRRSRLPFLIPAATPRVWSTSPI